ncbi:MAG: mandelate racemase/muconate lactonizing enzyme family protein [Nitrososphaeria archaeon]
MENNYIKGLETFPYGKRQVIVKIYSNDGTIGLGDATPLTSFTGENQKSILAAIEEFFRQRIINENPFNFPKILDRINLIPWNMAAKTAIEMALLDLVAKLLNIPLYNLLGGKSNDKFIQAVAVGKTGPEPPEKVAKEALNYVEMGFQRLKIKIGKKYGLRLEEDLERVETVANAIRGKAKFWVDCQGAYRPIEAINISKKIEKFDPLYIEQPVPTHDIDGLSIVKRNTNLPIIVDEGVFSPLDALKIIEKKAADVIGIKFAKCGGIFAAKKIVTLAEIANLECIMISPGETNIGLAAYLHIAASSKNVALCNFPFKRQESWLSKIEVDKGMILKVPDKKPGLGIDITNEIPKIPEWEFEDIPLLNLDQ